MSETTTDLTYDVFCAWVRDALGRLYDAAYLQHSPLIQHLVPSAERSAYPGKDLRKRLISAIHAKEPPRNAPPQSKDRRGYQILEQRFIAGLSPTEVAERLNISRSLFFLEQARMLDSLAVNLWDQRIEPETINIEATESTPQASTEALRLLENTTLTVVPMSKLLQSVSPLITSMGVSHGVNVAVSATEEGDVVHGSWVLLRQIILSVASDWMPRIKGGTFSIQAFAGHGVFGIQILATARDDMPGVDAEYQGMGSLHPDICRQLMTAMRGTYVSHQVTPRTWEVTLYWAQNRKSNVLLLVDDNQDIPDLIRRYLSGTAWTVIAVGDTTAARSALSEQTPDVILLDVLLPVEDGWEFLMSLKADDVTQTIPVIVCSAVGEESLATSLGAVAFLPKPLSESDLLRTLSALP